MECLKHFAVGKPVVIEETAQLSCPIAELEEFLRQSREFACGWIAHYDGQTPEEVDAAERAGHLTAKSAFYRELLRLIVRLKPEFSPE